MKNVKKNAILFKLFWFKVFVHRKLKLPSFPMDYVLINLVPRVLSYPPYVGRDIFGLERVTYFEALFFFN